MLKKLPLFLTFEFFCALFPALNDIFNCADFVFEILFLQLVTAKLVMLKRISLQFLLLREEIDPATRKGEQKLKVKVII